MSDKPEGPIYIPMAQMLSEQLTVQQLLRVADLALITETTDDLLR